jgi:hypothetical protein
MTATQAQRRSQRSKTGRQQIFISYRREDDGWALSITQALRSHFGDDRVFQDVDGIDAGTDFVERIEQALDESGAMLAIVGRNWMQLGPSGDGGIKDPNDFVRLEIATALGKGVPIIPVRLGDAAMPSHRELPDEIAKFGRLEAARLDRDYYKEGIGALTRRLESLIGKPAPKRRTSTPRAKPSTPPAATAAPEPTPSIPPFGATFHSTAMDEQRRAFEASVERWRNSPEAKARAAAYERREAEKAEVRATAPSFASLPAWWLSAVLTVVACLAVVAVADSFISSWLARVGIEISSRAPDLPQVGLALAWAAVYIYRGTDDYIDDPRRGRGVFLTRGILGGWRLLFKEGEFRPGLTGAFPLSILLAWTVTKLVTEPILGVLNWTSFYPLALVPLVLFSWWTISHYLEEAEFAQHREGW